MLPDLWASANLLLDRDTSTPEWLGAYMDVLSGSVAKTAWVSTDC